MMFSLSLMNRCGCKLKKNIDQMDHIKNTGFFALALTARMVRGLNSSFLFGAATL